MIRVLCLNPTIDRNYYIDSFTPGVAFHGTRVESYPGGKGLNIVKVLRSLGDETVLYAFVGGYNGLRIENEVKKLGSGVRLFHHEGETRMTINIMDRVRGEETEIKESGERVSAALEEEFLRTLEEDTQEGDIIVSSGSAIAGLSDDIYRKVSLIAERKKALNFLDAGGRYLQKALPGHYFFLKPNRREILDLFGVKDSPDEEEDFLLLAKGLQKTIQGNLLVTLGGDGALFVSDGKVLKAEVPEVEVVSTIGSGDSTVAGFCHAFASGLTVEDAIRFALSSGTVNAMHREVGSVTKEEVESLLPSIRLSAL